MRAIGKINLYGCLRHRARHHRLRFRQAGDHSHSVYPGFSDLRATASPQDATIVVPTAATQLPPVVPARYSMPGPGQTTHVPVLELLLKAQVLVMSIYDLVGSTAVITAET